MSNTKVSPHVIAEKYKKQLQIEHWTLLELEALDDKAQQIAFRSTGTKNAQYRGIHKSLLEDLAIARAKVKFLEEVVADLETIQIPFLK